jgi:lipoprotein-releasing system permease protein
MERTSMIGLFKAMGAKNITITQLFMWQGLKLIAKGVLIGNIVAFIFCIVQWKYELLPLGSENYYMEYVPIAFNIEYWFWSNIFFVLLLIIALLLPLAAIVAIKPAKAIRYA